MMIEEFEIAYEDAWTVLERGAEYRKHPFHTPVIGTIRDIEGHASPELRTVVLREVDRFQRTLRFQTDIRSPKWTDLVRCDQLSWLFYSFPDHLQIRIKSRATLHHKDEVSRSAWERVALLSRRCYLSKFGSTTPLEEFYPGMPEELIEREPTLEESLIGEENFGVVVGHIFEMEVLKLDYQGHRRMFFDMRNQEIASTWLSP